MCEKKTPIRLDQYELELTLQEQGYRGPSASCFYRGSFLTDQIHLFMPHFITFQPFKGQTLETFTQLLKTLFFSNHKKITDVILGCNGVTAKRWPLFPSFGMRSTGTTLSLKHVCRVRYIWNDIKNTWIEEIDQIIS